MLTVRKDSVPFSSFKELIENDDYKVGILGGVMLEDELRNTVSMLTVAVTEQNEEILQLTSYIFSLLCQIAEIKYDLLSHPLDKLGLGYLEYSAPLFACP